MYAEEASQGIRGAALEGQQEEEAVENTPMEVEELTPQTEEPLEADLDIRTDNKEAPVPATGFVNSAFDFILNPDVEEAAEDYSSSEDESE